MFYFIDRHRSTDQRSKDTHSNHRGEQQRNDHDLCKSS